MVWLPEENVMKVTVIDTVDKSNFKFNNVELVSTKRIDSLFSEIYKGYDYNPDNIQLSLKFSNGDTYILNEHKSDTFAEAGISWTPNEQLMLLVGRCDGATGAAVSPDNVNLSVSQALVPVKNIVIAPSACAEDDLLLGASASPTANTGNDGNDDTYEGNNKRHTQDVACNYVGLVNQAMTCYLNSLLQALYMTPEFRNALYNWEFDGVNESRSIPYQLQKLFLNLQTSPKSAVETTDLTTSFGWQGSDAWHQHDIQELCRVMFDALEQKFKDTKQANLINDLYEGKMLDYVKCLDCGTEKSREDTFLDIPLPVRPFGSAVAYNSVEEALRAFVQPETLDGNNQYHCEKCNKKCDAHKGLKFTKFPYLLTLHLKRFDFDYSTMHRIKLNDKVVFPEILNLNSFITTSRLESEPMEERENAKCDDCSTTDSGSADDESCQGTDVSSTANGHDNCADSDEGIDVSSGNNHDEDAKGPYIYELFSIMIHSGSASGGHYYAYIKDFDKNMWFCFNDQSVSGITEDDIRKTYGGGPQRGYYSGAYSSSTNAYMLMYRRIDKERNCRAMAVEDFPPHLKKLLQGMRRKEEEERINKEKENEMIKLSVYGGRLSETASCIKIPVFLDSTLGEATQEAYQKFKLDGVVNIEDCRLVVFNRKQDCIDWSFESNDLKFKDIMKSNQQMICIFADWLLEIRQPGTSWYTYKAGGINMKVYPVIMETEEVDEPKFVRVDVGDRVYDLKCKLGNMLGIYPSTVKVVMEMFSNEPKYLENDDMEVKFDPNCNDYKLYVSKALDEDPEKTFQQSKLKKIIEHFSYIISLNVVLPPTDIATLESMSIPSLDLNQNLDKLEMVGDCIREGSSPASLASGGGGLRGSPQPTATVSDVCFGGGGDQSNSEDSSLSDSDRTLVGDAPGECLGLVSSSCNSPAENPHRTPSPVNGAGPGGDPCEDAYNYEALGQPGLEDMNWDDVTDVTTAHDNMGTNAVQRCDNYYFKVTSMAYNNCATDASDDRCARCCRVLADKRMTLERFKKHLEGLLRVPSEYFKIFRQYPNSDDEWSCLSDTLRSTKDGERLIVKLGRVLRKDEIKCSIFYLKQDCSDVNHFLFEHIIAKGQTIGAVKKEVLFQAKKQHMIDIPYNKCRLREKTWKRPRRVYLDDQKIGRDVVTASSHLDMFLQELDEPETVTSKDQVVLFVRQWCPSTLSLKPFQEVVLENSTIEELKRKISVLTGIPPENVDIAYIKANIPCDMHLLDIHYALDWNPNVTHLEQWPLNADHGSVFYFRDSRESLKELTAEERKDLNQKENTRLGRLSIKSYSPGRERALKIYLDTSPSKSDDNLD